MKPWGFVLKSSCWGGEPPKPKPVPLSHPARVKPLEGGGLIVRFSHTDLWTIREISESTMSRRSKADTDKELAKYFKKGELEQMLGEAVGEALSGRAAGKTGRKRTRRKTA